MTCKVTGCTNAPQYIQSGDGKKWHLPSGTSDGTGTPMKGTIIPDVYCHFHRKQFDGHFDREIEYFRAQHEKGGSDWPLILKSKR